MNRNHPFAVWLCLTLVAALAMAGAFWFGAKGSMAFMILGISCIVILGVRDKLECSNRQGQRTEQLSQRAAELGFEFQEQASFNLLGWDESFELTRKAFAFQSVIDESSLLGRFASLAMPKSRNVLMRCLEDARLALFDYEFSDDDVTYHQAIAAVQSPRIDHPYFALVPTNAWDKFTSGFRQASALYTHHRLKTETTLPASDVAAIAESLAPYTTLEVGNGYLLLYRTDRRPLDPNDIEAKITEVMRVYAAVMGMQRSVSLRGRE